MIALTQPEISESQTQELTRLRLISVAVKGLSQMFDPIQQLFCFTLRPKQGAFVQEGISRRYSVITLMGLHRLEQAGTPSPIDLPPVLDSLLADTSWIDNIGDFGLVLWLCSLMAPERIEEINRRVKITDALTYFRDVQQARTMELSWFLAGLSHCLLAAPELLDRIEKPAYETYRLICKNQGRHGAFAHLAETSNLVGRFRGWIGSFADQVYPIYAMSRFFQAFGEATAKQRAVDCARVICEAQGPLGQWWWHYNVRHGGVFEGYPVFSVHQHGMAPMTLFALQEVTQSDVSANINKGIQWISRNELDITMEDPTGSVFWRCIFRPTLNRYLSAATNLRLRRHQPQASGGLSLKLECRPYELGWLLYAFAGRERGKHLSEMTKSGLR